MNRLRGCVDVNRLRGCVDVNRLRGCVRSTSWLHLTAQSGHLSIDISQWPPAASPHLFTSSSSESYNDSCIKSVISNLYHQVVIFTSYYHKIEYRRHT